MNPMAVLLGLTAAVTLGVGDFAGGAAARTRQPTAVAAWTWGSVGVAGLVVGPMGTAPFRPAVLWWGISGGLLAAVGTTLLFYGLANARVAIVAPLSAVSGASVPVLLDGLSGSQFSTTVVVGIVLALVGVVLTTWSRGGGPGSIGLSIATGLGAGLALALVFVVTANTLDDGVWVIAPVGLAAFTVIAVGSRATRRSMRIAGPAVGWTAIAGLGTAVAYTSFLLSAAESSFGLAAVVTSMYPAVTVLAAIIVWRERPAAIQLVGLSLIVAAVALLGSG